MRVKINRAGKFGNFLANFGAKCFSHIHARGNREWPEKNETGLKITVKLCHFSGNLTLWLQLRLKAFPRCLVDSLL